jgi:hypothetical protein
MRTPNFENTPKVWHLGTQRATKEVAPCGHGGPLTLVLPVSPQCPFQVWGCCGEPAGVLAI